MLNCEYSKYASEILLVKSYRIIVPILSNRGIQVLRSKEKYENKASPMICDLGTKPQYLESKLSSRLSPIAQ